MTRSRSSDAQARRLERRRDPRVEREDERQRARDRPRASRRRARPRPGRRRWRAGAASPPRTVRAAPSRARTAADVEAVEVARAACRSSGCRRSGRARRRRPRGAGCRCASGLVTNSRSDEEVGDAPVDLLGHRVVEAAQAGLDVGEREQQLGARRAPPPSSSSRRRRRRRAPGARPRNASSSATMSAAVWTACVPEPTPRLTSGAGSPRSRKNTSDIARVVVLAGVDEPLRRRPLARARARTGAAFMKFGRAPTTCTTVWPMWPSMPVRLAAHGRGWGRVCRVRIGDRCPCPR